ncbi:MAG TPA: hypothetical protein V6D17_17945 [Candidatus Obscuribacterales bacterium]
MPFDVKNVQKLILRLSLEVLKDTTRKWEQSFICDFSPRDDAGPRSWRQLLLECSSADVRIAIAESNDVPSVVLWQLAQDENPDVRYALAENHNVDFTLLRALTCDENPFVSSRAAYTLHNLRLNYNKKLRQLQELRNEDTCTAYSERGVACAPSGSI